jgi:hypothetical protein
LIKFQDSLIAEAAGSTITYTQDCMISSVPSMNYFSITLLLLLIPGFPGFRTGKNFKRSFN